MKSITWKLHLKASSEQVFDLLSSPEGMMKFWVEKASQKNDQIHFTFPNGQTYTARILKFLPGKEFHLIYFDTVVKFYLKPLEKQGTDLILLNEQIPEDDLLEVHAGWVSVLMNLKAVADFDSDLRNHNSDKTWDQGYVNN